MSYNPYLGEEPPADAYVSMNVDDEYEGGEWSDGEFYYEKKKERPNRNQSKAEAIYGVWADEQDEEEENERLAAKQRGRRDEEVISDDDEEEAVEGAGRRGLGLAASASQRKEVTYGRRQAASQSSSLLTRTMKFVASSSSSTLRPPTDDKPSTAPQPPTHSSAPPTTTSVSASPASVHESAPTTTLSFKRRRLAQQAEINRQKQPDPLPPTSTSPITTHTAPHRPFRPPTVDADYAAFTQHSTPAVLQMMERMGFRGRLGKHETGVALPILPQVRPKGVGLGGVKEKVQRVGRNAEEEEKMEQEKEREQERKKKEKADRGGAAAAVVAVAGGGAREKAWERGERRGKTVYKTAHEVIRQHSTAATTTSASTTKPTVIIDMTSGTPVQKQLSSLSSSTSSPATISATQPSACPELVHNVQLLCDLCENDIIDTEKQIERLTLDIDEMERETGRLTVRARKGQEAERRLEAVMSEVSEVERWLKESSSAAGMSSVTVRSDMLQQLYHRLQRQYMREWRMYGLVRVVVVMLLPLLRELAGRWEVLPKKAVSAADATGELLDELKRWRALLDDDSTSAVYYDELVNTLLLPPLRLALSSTTLPLQQPSRITPLFQQLRTVLPTRLYSSVVSSLLLPRLQRLLTGYSPRSMAAPYWLLSYASVVSTEELQSLASVVRQRLMLTIGGWRVEDEVERKEAVQYGDEVEEAEESMVDKVAGWKGVWKEEEMDAFLSRYIQPRLLAAITGLRSSATTSPLSSLPLVSAVLSWSPLFSALALTPILSAVLSHFLSILYSLLSQREPDFEQASDVYEQWKTVLTARAVEQRVTVDEVSRLALTMMNAAMTDSDVSTVYRDAIRRLQPSKPAAAAGGGEVRRAAAVVDNRGSVSMRDVLYAFGSQHGFDVYPHGRRSVSAHDVYWFGGVQLYWTGEDVYAMDERSKEWEMVSLSQLLQLAKQAQARGKT